MKKHCILLFVLLLLTGCSRQEYYTDTYPTEITDAYTSEIVQQTENLTVPEMVPAQPLPPESEDTFVRVVDYIPTASQALMYATEKNFTGQVIYDFEDAYLRWGTVKKLMLVSEDWRNWASISKSGTVSVLYLPSLLFGRFVRILPM